MIYVSSACVRNKYIKDSVQELVDAGFKNIELSGGTQLYNELTFDLLELKEKYNLNYICHNYFPPPAVPFVLNLASLDNQIHQKSIEHLESSIKLSEVLGAKKFGFHAGFLINIPLEEIGKSIASRKLFNRAESRNRFIESFRRLQESTSVELYIENNVLSALNYQNFDEIDPFFMTTSLDISSHMEEIDFGLILDVAHLKVSARTLGTSFEKELNQLLPLSNYVHISDNDGESDSNEPLRKKTEIFELLNKQEWKGKIATLEIYSSIEEIQKSYQLLEIVMNG
jgi:sugar phosphate isomerase/epimerase